jgi:acyl carrier protein
MSKILEILKEVRPDSDFESCSDFIEEELLDSLDVIRLTSSLDSAFSISIEGEDILPENFNSLCAIKEMVKKYKKEPI